VDLSPALMQMAGLVLSRESVDTALKLVTTLAETTIPGTVGAGVTLVDGHGKRSRAASNPGCGTGGHPAVPTRRRTVSDSLAIAVSEVGVRSMVSAPLVIADEAIGAIKVYSDRPANYDEHAVQVMSLFAQQAAILLANTESLQEARHVSRQLTDALGSRDAIGRATGVLLAQGMADERAAFTVLTETAQRSRQTVEQVARELLAALATRNADHSTT
jgi:ANTAR domain/GAF domain